MERGRLALCGALDLLDLFGGPQLIFTPVYLICVDPLQPRYALWTIYVRHVVCAQIVSQDERVVLSEQLEVCCYFTLLLLSSYTFQTLLAALLVAF